MSIEHVSQVYLRIKEAGHDLVGVGYDNGIVLHGVSPEVEAQIRSTVDLTYHQPPPTEVPLWKLLSLLESQSPEGYAALMQTTGPMKHYLANTGAIIQITDPEIIKLAAQLGISDLQAFFTAANQIQVTL